MKFEKKEFIGKKIKVIDSQNKFLVGIQGVVIDETKNTLVVLENNKKKTLLKNQIIFELEGKKIDGKSVSLRPEDRIKKTKKT